MSSLISSQTSLVKHLTKNKVIQDKQIAEVFQVIDRKHYTPQKCLKPYQDSPQYLGYGATISAPHMHAFALEYLIKWIPKAKKILDVGSGTGYLTVALALLSSKECKVYGIEHVPELVKMSLNNICKDNHEELLKTGKIQIFQGDGRKGWQLDQSIQFDLIHIGAAASKIPDKLIQQLAPGGRMVLPLGKQSQTQEFIAIDKNIDTLQISKTVLNHVRYVPLTDLKKQTQQN